MKTKPSESNSTDQRGRNLRFGILVTIMLWCAIPLSPSTVDSDFWGHVRYGADTLQHGVASTATYTFTAEGFRWINHENLSEITFAWLTKTFGHQSVLVMKCLFGCLVIGLIVLFAVRKSVATGIISVVAGLVAVNLSFYWGMRPQVFSFTFFAIVIALGERFLSYKALSQLSRRAFVLLTLSFAVLFALWANSHGGFVAGICVFNLLLVFRAIEAFKVGRDITVIRRCVLLITVCSLTTLINPYGIELHLWLIESLRIPRPEVMEWHPPNLFGPDSLKIWALIGFSFVGIVSTQEKRDWAKIVVFGVVLAQALSHQRHLPFVAILFGFWLPEHLQSLWLRLRSKIIPDTEVKNSLSEVPWSAIGLLGVISLMLAFQVGVRMRSVEVLFRRYPVAAMQFMADNEIFDSMVVTSEWSQYVLAVAGARTPQDDGCRVAFDGRFRTCYPQTVVDMHFDFFRGDMPSNLRYRSSQSPPADPTRVLEFHSPNLVLLNTLEHFAVDAIRQTDQWCLLYKDRTAELWGRSIVYDQPHLETYIAEHRRIDTSDASTPAEELWQRSVEWPAKPTLVDPETVFLSQSTTSVKRTVTVHRP